MLYLICKGRGRLFSFILNLLLDRNLYSNDWEEEYMFTKKLIAIDLDGTLLQDDGSISQKTAKVVAEVLEAGHKIVIATGRHTSSALPIAKQLGLTDAIITFNGALIMNLKNKKEEVSYAYSPDEVSNLIAIIKTLGYPYIASTKACHFIEPDYRFLVPYYSDSPIHIGKLYTNEISNPSILKTTILGEENNLKEIEPVVKALLPNHTVVRSGETSLDVMDKKASKGEALHWLAKYYQVDREDIISFGNYHNDLSMLEFAGTGVAVANAPKEVQERADVITDSNEADGVARFLEENILNKAYVK